MSGERTTYQYDFEGNLIGERVYNYQRYALDNKLYEIINNFDEDGNIIKNAIKTHSGTLTNNYAFDAESGLPSSVTLFGGRQVSYTYDDEGTLTGRSLSTNTPVNESFSLNDDGLISTHTIAHGTDSDAYSYTYDDNYNITEIKKGNTVQQSYEYDALNQLIRENDRDTGKTVTYSYDGYGNITSKTEYAFTLGELGAVIDTISYAYNDTAWKDKLTSYDGQAITYDEIGNPITYRGATMTWFGRQMMSYSKNGTSISYTYDADGLRTSKTVNGVKHNYYYVDGQLRYERNGDSYEIYYTYDADGRPVLATKRDLVAQKNYQYYLITNTRGDVIETRNGDGNVNAKFVYDAWGKLVAVTDANGNALSTDSFAYQISLKYRGYVYDNETGLYYLQSRYYDPETGRFLNADDVGFIGYSGEQLSYNIFAYCENNAVNRVDCFGFMPINNFLGLFYKTKEILMYIFSALIRAKSISEQAINLSSYKSRILSMNRLSQTIHYDMKYDLLEIDTIAETNRWYFNESYTIVTYSTTVENWYNIYDSVSEKMRIKSIKELVDSALEVFTGLAIGKLFAETVIATAFSKLSIAAGIIGVPIGVLGLMVSDSVGDLEKNLRYKNESYTYTFNWVVVHNSEYFGQKKQKAVLEWYCDLAYYMGAFL